MNRNPYRKTSTTYIRLSGSGPILAGSVKHVAVSQNVSVNEYEDGFEDKGGFEELTFE